jgi:pimeloyl-ACP methyl ester carboxylesterase
MYSVAGQGTPIYFIHGLGVDSVSMSTIYDRWINNEPYRRYYVDLPGMGDTTNVEGVNSTDDVVDLLADFIMDTSDGEPIILVGHSYGGYLCFALAVRMRRVRGVFTTCPVVIADASKRSVSDHANILIDTDFGSASNSDSDTNAFHDYLKINVQICQRTWHEYQQMIMPGLRRFNARHWTAIQQNGRYELPDEPGMFARLAATDIPIYTMVGDNDNVVGFNDQFDKLSRLPHGVLTLVHNTGHNLPIDAPERVEKSWDEFICAID